MTAATALPPAEPCLEVEDSVSLFDEAMRRAGRVMRPASSLGLGALVLGLPLAAEAARPAPGSVTADRLKLPERLKEWIAVPQSHVLDRR